MAIHLLKLEGFRRLERLTSMTKTSVDHIDILITGSRAWPDSDQTEVTLARAAMVQAPAAIASPPVTSCASLRAAP